MQDLIYSKQNVLEQPYILVWNSQRVDAAKNKYTCDWLQAVEREDIWYMMIRHNAHKMMPSCCMKLKLIDFLCRQIFAIMKYANMKEIPSGCSLRWWTIGAKKQIELNEDSIAHEEDNLFDKSSKVRDS